MRYFIEVDDSSPFFNPEENGVTIVAFTRGIHGEALMNDLQIASDEGLIMGDFHIAKVCTSDDPSNHQGDTCEIHEA
jgi:hypothetical protein